MFKALSGVAAVAAALFVLVSPSPSHAVVYCKKVGVPKGCVVRPGAPGVGAPGVGAPGPGVAPGVGAPGRGANAGGPVNRAGAR